MSKYTAPVIPFQLKLAIPSSAIASSPVGTLIGVTPDDAAEASDIPAAFVAVTVNV
jgi:hypothetical protein